MSMVADIATGTVEGTGSAINIICGFQPRIVKLYNIDGDAVMNWNASMGADKGYKELPGTGADALVASGGVTALKNTTGEGFTIGTDGDVNASAETICWEAYR